MKIHISPSEKGGDNNDQESLNGPHIMEKKDLD